MGESTLHYDLRADALRLRQPYATEWSHARTLGGRIHSEPSSNSSVIGSPPSGSEELSSALLRKGWSHKRALQQDRKWICPPRLHDRRWNVHTGNKGSESQQKQNCEAGGIRIEQMSCTVGSNSRFIAAKKANQCAAWVQITGGSPAFLSCARRQPLQIQTIPITGTRNCQKPVVGCFVKLV